MIKCNLAVLLSERNLRITKVSKDTGISRTTLTALYYNHGQGIQFDTMNQLCVYLSVTPEKLFNFVPFDVKIKTEVGGLIRADKSIDSISVVFSIKELGKTSHFIMIGEIEKELDSSGFIESVTIDLDFDSEISEDGNYAPIDDMLKYFSEIPIIFRADFEQEIDSKIFDAIVHANRRLLNDEMVADGYDSPDPEIFFYWPRLLTFKTN